MQKNERTENMALWEVKKFGEKKITKRKDGKVQTETKRFASLEDLNGAKMQVELSDEKEISVGDIYNFKPDKSQKKITEDE